MPHRLCCRALTQSIQVLSFPDLFERAAGRGFPIDLEKESARWVLPLDQVEEEELGKCLELLTGQEKQRAVNFRHEGARIQFIAGHAVIHLILRAILGEDYHALHFRESPHKKPFVSMPDGTRPLEYNLSHCEGFVAVAFGLKPQGIDIEKVRRLEDFAGICRQVFTETEIKEVFSDKDGKNQTETFFRFWTCKEAALKANGTGFMLDPRNLEIQTEDSLPPEAEVYWTRAINGYYLAWTEDLSF